LVKTIIALSGEESQINCWDGEAAIKDERFVRGGVLEKTTHIGGPRDKGFVNAGLVEDISYIKTHFFHFTPTTNEPLL